VIREIGVETGGSNIQFGVHPTTGRMVVIEMNPRVSRSSALASKATGFPIAKIAAKLAVGYTLDEIPNDITRKTPACFEPTLDYVVVKIPKWQFEKFPGADESLGPQMKSVGEVMAIGRTFKEALLKGVRALDTGKKVGSEKIEPKILTQRLVTPHPERLSYIRYALRQGHTVKQLAKMTSMDPWFLYQLKEINDMQLEPHRSIARCQTHGHFRWTTGRCLEIERKRRTGQSPPSPQEAWLEAGLQACGHVRGRI
jgi:carbamoyl-phosphate synthase large subunit